MRGTKNLNFFRHLAGLFYQTDGLEAVLVLAVILDSAQSYKSVMLVVPSHSMQSTSLDSNTSRLHLPVGVEKVPAVHRTQLEAPASHAPAQPENSPREHRAVTCRALQASPDPVEYVPA